VATVIIWLTVFAMVWVIMEPSRRNGEMLHDARSRMTHDTITDPLFWFSALFVAYAAIRAFNGGVGLSYDPELTKWTVSKPTFEMMPGGVDGSGYFPFAATLALAVLLLGMRHALGRSARAVYLLVGSILSAAAGFTIAVAISYGHTGVSALAACDFSVASFLGVAFGLQLLATLLSLFTVVGNGWVKVEPLVVLALVGNGIGMLILSPPHVIAVFTIAYLLLAVICFAFARRSFAGSGSFRCALAILMSLAAPVMYALATSDTPAMAAKLAAFADKAFFPAQFFARRSALSAIALESWRGNPWLGTGLGSFPLDIRFAAKASDWLLFGAGQQTALNGWWQLLVERGVVGALVFAVTLGMLFWTFVTRVIAAFRSARFAVEFVLVLFYLAVLIALAFVDCSYLRPEVLMIAGTGMAISGGGMPHRSRSEQEGRDK